MTGVGKRGRSEEGRELDTVINGSPVPAHPQQLLLNTSTQQLLHLNPLHYRHIFHRQQQGLLTLKAANLRVSPDTSPGLHQTFTSWSRQETESLQSGDVCASALGCPPSRATPVIVCYNSANGETSIPPSARGRDPVLSNPLFFHGFCKWPGCDQVFKDYETFLKHLNEIHCLNDTSTAQCLIQTERVHQLQSKKVFDISRKDISKSHPAVSFLVDLPGIGACSVAGNSQSLSLSRNQLQEKYDFPFSEINPTLEYYRIYNVRPPLTYAALIRWAILEAAERQLTLNEIYHWFTRTFAFFRYNTATWKNAVRHNLSLHKCFVRVENVKGSVWTVDEVEFQRRRGQKAARYAEEDGSSTKATAKTLR
ncbi:forkhead box protein P1-B-like isoform X2 [Mustelus asterias]